MVRTGSTRSRGGAWSAAAVSLSCQAADRLLCRGPQPFAASVGECSLNEEERLVCIEKKIDSGLAKVKLQPLGVTCGCTSVMFRPLLGLLYVALDWSIRRGARSAPSSAARCGDRCHGADCLSCPICVASGSIAGGGRGCLAIDLGANAALVLPFVRLALRNCTALDHGKLCGH